MARNHTLGILGYLTNSSNSSMDDQCALLFATLFLFHRSGSQLHKFLRHFKVQTLSSAFGDYVSYQLALFWHKENTIIFSYSVLLIDTTPSPI